METQWVIEQGLHSPTLKINQIIDQRQKIQADIAEIVETPKGAWIDDVIGSFGAYSTPYKDDGTAKTIGEMGAEQAASITAIRKERKNKQDLAKLSKLERELALRDKESERAYEFDKLAKGFEYRYIFKTIRPKRNDGSGSIPG